MNVNITIAPIVLIAAGVLATSVSDSTAPATGSQTEQRSWRTDPAWYQGKAEWALYDAERFIYGEARSYEATIFTNKQHMETREGHRVKADRQSSSTVEVFKHNVSEIIPTDNYDYRFLTTSFVRTDTLEPFKLVMSSQEDCGATYKQITFEGGDGGQVDAISHCYFPETGDRNDSYRLPGKSKHFHMHDDLTLALRDFPFDDPASADVMMKIIADQTHTRPTPTVIAEAQIHYEGRETISVPYGTLETHHLRITHEPMNDMGESHYWFAADEANMRHVLVQYEGPYGVKYRLKRLDWWAYWADPRPE